MEVGEERRGVARMVEEEEPRDRGRTLVSVESAQV